MAHWVELTYRTKSVDQRYVLEMAQRLVGQSVVIRITRPKETASGHPWKRGTLMEVYPDSDRFRVKWSKRGFGRILVGIWRVHNAKLFTDKALPEPRGVARVPDIKQTNPRRVTMPAKATKRGAKAKAGAAATNGRVKDKLGHLTEAQRRKAANLIFKMKNSGEKWDAIFAALDKQGTPIPGSMTGRKLLRDYHDSGESAIRERNLTGASTKSKPTNKKAAPKGKAAPAKRGPGRPKGSGTKRKVRVKTERGTKSPS